MRPAASIIMHTVTRRYKNNDIAQLAHQLTISPRRQRPSQIAGAERLLELVEAEREYPYDFVCFHLTGYRPLRPSTKPALRGGTLIADLVRLIEHLSQSASIPLEALREPVHTQEELSQRLSVSMKTIARWRQRGLSGLRVVGRDRVSRLVFTEKALQRFVARNRELVLRGGAFRQLTDAERRQIIDRATELVSGQRMKLQDVARSVADETGRAIETIRYTLRRHDRESASVASRRRSPADSADNVPSWPATSGNGNVASTASAARRAGSGRPLRADTTAETVSGSRRAARRRPTACRMSPSGKNMKATASARRIASELSSSASIPCFSSGDSQALIRSLWRRSRVPDLNMVANATSLLPTATPPAWAARTAPRQESAPGDGPLRTPPVRHRWPPGGGCRRLAPTMTGRESDSLRA